MAEPAANTRQQTRDVLLATATRLFAERGLDGVSLAEINREAGQRNATALHYHFGGKQGLLQAIFDKHRPRVNTLREQLLAELPAQATAKQVVNLLISPLAEQVQDGDGGCDYLQFLAQTNALPGAQQGQLDQHNSSVLDQQRLAFTRLLENLPQDVARLRAGFMVQMVFAALSRYAGQVQEQGFDQQSHLVFVEELTAAAAAVLAQ